MTIGRCIGCHHSMNIDDHSQVIALRDGGHMHRVCAAQGVSEMQPQLSMRSRGMSQSSSSKITVGQMSDQIPLEAQLDIWVKAVKSKTERQVRARVINIMNLSGAKLVNNHIKINADLDLQDIARLTSLPDNLHVKGNLILRNCEDLKSLPKNLIVDGDLILNGCKSLKKIPQNTIVKGDLDATNAISLDDIASDLSVGRDLYLSGCRALGHVPALPNVRGDIDLTYCTNLQQLGLGFVCKGNLDLDGCHSLIELPDGLIVNGHLYLEQCTALAFLPQQMTLGGYLDITGCTSITELPAWVLQLGPMRSSDNSRGVSLERNVVLTASGLPESLIEQLVDHHAPGLNFIVDLDASQELFQNKIQTRVGHEAEDLLKALRTVPYAPVVIKYEEGRGIDYEGLSRQAFDQAYHQLINSKHSLFVPHKSTGIYSTKVLKPGQVQGTSLIRDAQDLGIIIGRLARLHAGIGYQHEEGFIANLFQSYQYVVSQRSAGQGPRIVTALEALVDTKQRAKWPGVLKEVQPHLYSEETAFQYLKNAPEDEMFDYAVDAAISLGVALGMKQAGMRPIHEEGQFQDRVCGPRDLKALLKNRLGVTAEEGVDPSLVSTLNEWMQRALTNATPPQLKNIMQEMNGSRYVTTSVGSMALHLCKTMPVPHVMFIGHTCSRTIDVSEIEFKKSVDAHQYDGFENAFLNCASKKYELG